MNRKRFLISAVGAGTVAVGAPWSIAGAATDDEIAYANFCVSAELLLEDHLG